MVLAPISQASGQGPDAAAIRNARNANVLAAFYPPRAIAAGEEGQVGFQVKIDAEGNPTECVVTRSSGYPLLDTETCNIITLHAVFPKVNQSVETRTQVSTHEGAINWRLPKGAPAAAQPVTLAQASNTKVPEKIVCKRTLKGDSHIGYERVCMTATDWERGFDETRTLWREIRSKGSSGGN